MAAGNFGQGQDLVGPCGDARHLVGRKPTAQDKVSIVGELCDLGVGEDGCIQHDFFNGGADAGCLLPQFS